MTSHVGTRLITNGLILCFDPNNSRSYPGSGTILYDLSGNENHGTLYGSPTFSQNYLNFDGVDDYIQFPSILLSRASAFYSIWVYVDDFTTFTSGKTVDSRILVRGEAGYNRVLALYEGGFGFETNTNSNPNDIASNLAPGDFPHSEITAGVWFQFAMNFDNNVVYTYINGEQKRTFNVSDNLQLNYIGRIQDPTNYPDYLKGRFGGFLIYDRSLSDNEIKLNYQAYLNRYI